MGAIVYGTVPSDAIVAQFEGTSVQVRRWVDIYEADNTTLWRSAVQLTDGTISVDSTRDERRNMDLTLYDGDGDLGYGPGFLWYDKIFKPYRGIQLADVPVPGYISIDALTSGQYIVATRSAFTSVTVYELAARVSFAELGVLQAMAGWNGGPFLPHFEVKSSGKLFLSMALTDHSFAGAVDSSIAIPGLAVNTPVWLRAKLTVSTSVLNYYYSYDDTNDYDLVNWTVLGTAQTGAHTGGTLDLSGSTQVIFGADYNGNNSMHGKIYAGAEITNTTGKQVEFDVTDFPEGASSFVATTGQTFTLVGDFINLVPATFVEGDVWVTSLGEFLPDVIDRPRFPHTIHITGRDFTKKLLQSKFGQVTAFAAGTGIASTIQNLATNGGISKFNFVTDATTLASTVTFEADDSRWKAMTDLATAIGMELFFDSYGYLTLRPFVDPLTAPLYYTFRTGVSGNLVDYGRSTNDSELFNRVVVRGDSVNNPLVYGEATNTTVTSPTRIAAIGERMMPTITNAFVASNLEAEAIAIALLAVAGLEQYELKFDSIAVPWLEGGVAIEAVLPDSAPSDPTRFLLTDFTIPMNLGPMSSTARRITIVT